MWRIIFWGAVAFTLVTALLPLPPQLRGAPSDKIQHIIAFVALSVLAAGAYGDVGLLRIALLLAIFGALIEILQMIPMPNRDASPVDWALMWAQ